MDYSGEQYDVIVVGAGVMGSSAAYQVAKRGQKTLLLEQFDLLHHRGSSHGESRTILAAYPKDYYCQMVLESYSLWEQAESEVGHKVHFKTKNLDMGPADSAFISSRIANCKKFSWPYHQNLCPTHFSLPEKWVGLSTELGGVIKATKAVSMFQTLALQNGAILKDHMEVVGIVRDETEGGVRVSTRGGDKFWGKKCVVSVGAWMSQLVKSVRGIELPIQPLEVMVYYWRIKEGHDDEFSIGGGFPTFASATVPTIYGTPALEFPGLIKINVHGGYAKF